MILVRHTTNFQDRTAETIIYARSVMIIAGAAGFGLVVGAAGAIALFFILTEAILWCVQ